MNHTDTICQCIMLLVFDTVKRQRHAKNVVTATNSPECIHPFFPLDIPSIHNTWRRLLHRPRAGSPGRARKRSTDRCRPCADAAWLLETPARATALTRSFRPPPFGCWCAPASESQIKCLRARTDVHVWGRKQGGKMTLMPGQRHTHTDVNMHMRAKIKLPPACHLVYCAATPLFSWCATTNSPSSNRKNARSSILNRVDIFISVPLLRARDERGSIQCSLTPTRVTDIDGNK